ncbi:condensation domain-containing protein [Acerihabitans sp. KWT182]|uniref:Condensation domain-containing protein n=1 Tax=Acerihabitans sp. KWT182 TaxID=3157919 RepID=A0AAU7Q497_9GAMM
MTEQVFNENSRRLPQCPGEQGLSEQQASLWFLARLAPDDAAYNIACACRSFGELDIPALRDAMLRLTGRHEVLRSVFYR